MSLMNSITYEDCAQKECVRLAHQICNYCGDAFCSYCYDQLRQSCYGCLVERYEAGEGA